MDKNFISVDDLVRQRLGGEEEKERPGAWLQMRDLLDKEMPQDRGGFLYWRRTFSAVALLLLATSASVGGYLYATRSTNAATSNAIVANDLASNNLSVSNNTTGNTSKTPAENTAAENTTANNTPVKHTSAKKAGTTHNTDHAAPAGLAANTPTENTPAASSTGSTNNSKTPNTNEVNSTKQLSSGPVAAAKKSNKEQTHQLVSNSPSGNVVATAPALHTGKQSLASGNSPARSSEHQAKKEVSAKKHFLATVIAANDRNKKIAADNRKKEDAQKLIASNTTGSSKSATPLTEGTAGKTAHHTSHKSKEAKTGATKPDGLASAAPSQQTLAHHTNGQKKDQVVSADKLALGSGATGTKTLSSGTAKSPVESEKLIAGSNTMPGNAKTSAPKQTPVTGVGNGPSNKSKTGATASHGAAPSSAETAPGNVAAKRETIQVDRVTIAQRYISKSSAEGSYKNDTISIEQLAREIGMNTGNSGNAHHPEESRKEENGAPTNSAANTNSNNSSNSSNAVASANSPVVPESSASATGKNGLGTKQAQTAKGGSGESTLEKLNATFNDVKYHVSGMQFAPGLTGGINATFFGPNSFKGFQFGVTGNFIFGDNVSAMAEVKYFHRINNDYSLNDNYSSYTQVGPGQWSKQQLSNSYSFSTLHSVELPITLRFVKSHFNFYAGGNFVYSFAINTGKSELPSTLAPVLVSSVGNDNTPKVQQSDFNSRFGIGYIAGISYEVYPNVTLDFRNVQTVWDNGASQGAKYISNQLYKSPSFQVSVGYRLGNNKKKD